MTVSRRNFCTMGRARQPMTLPSLNRAHHLYGFISTSR